MNNKQILIRIYKQYVKKHLKKILISFILSIFVAGSTSSIAWLLDPAIEKIFIEKDKSLTLIIPIFIIFAFAIKGLSLYFARSNIIEVGKEVAKEFQGQITKSILDSDVQKIDEKHSGKFISHTIYDVSLIVNLASTTILNLMKDSFTLIALLGVMFYQNWNLALFAIIMIPLASFAAKSLGKRMGKVTTEAQERSGMLIKYLSEILKSSKIIKIYQKEKFELNRASNFISEFQNKNAKIALVMIRATPIMEMLTGIMIAGLILYSSLMVDKGTLQINNFFSFLAAMMLAYQPVRSLATLNIGINQGTSAAKRLFSILDEENKIKNFDNNKDLKIEKGSIEFENVCFSYPSKQESALNKLNMKIPGGNVVALVGHSGAGKTTALNLIPRFYDPHQGKILIDNQSIYDVNLSSLRKNLSLVSQDVILFDDTIISNIAFAKLDASRQEIIEACKFACADEFIKKLPNKYETIIGENGLRLSGGQKQRISIARAILKNSPIILLDEATSSLDADSEQKVQDAIMYLTKNKTTIIIAHRLSTIFNAKKIFVIEKGKVVAEGNHTDLIKNSNIYKNFYNKQLNKH